MYQLIEFYKPVEQGKMGAFERGMIFWTCVHRPFLSHWIKRWTESKVWMIDVTRFNSNLERDDPSNDTKAGEFWGLNNYKKRPVVILSSTCQEYPDSKLHGDELLVVAPLVTIRDEITNEYKYGAETVWDAVSYKIKPVFYLPKSEKGEVRESFILFERMHSIHCSWLAPAFSIRLSNDALGWLDVWLRNYMFGAISVQAAEEIKVYRELIGEDPQYKASATGMGRYLNT